MRPPAAAADAFNLKPRGLHDDADVLPVTPDRCRVGDAVAPVRQRHEAPIAVVAAQHIAAVDGELEQAVEGGAIQGGVGQGSADFLEQRIGMHRLAAGAAQNVLRHHIERAGAWRLAVELAVLDGGECRLAFQRLEAVRGHEKRAAGNVQAVVRAANPLQQPAHALRRRHLDHQIHITPIDAQLQRRRGNHAADLPRRHHGLGAPPEFAVERAMIECDRQVILIRVPEHLQHQLGLRARVHEDDGGAGVADRLVNRGHSVAGHEAAIGDARVFGHQDADIGLGTQSGLQHARGRARWAEPGGERG